MRYEGRVYGTRDELIAELKRRGTTPGSSEGKALDTARAAARLEDGWDEVQACHMTWVVEDTPDRGSDGPLTGC